MIWSMRLIWQQSDLWDHNQSDKQYNECQCMKEAQEDWCFDQEKCFRLISTDEISSLWWEAVKDHKKSYHWMRERDCQNYNQNSQNDVFVRTDYFRRNLEFSI